jgi:hypothetical protein
MLIGRTIRQSCCRICFEELCNTWEVSPALYGPRGGLYQSTETKGLTTMRSNRDDPLCSYSNPQVADNARPYHLPPPGLGKSSVSIQIRATWPSARPALWGSACCAGGDDAGDEAAVNADLAKPTGPEPTGFARDSPLEGEDSNPWSLCQGELSCRATHAEGRFPPQTRCASNCPAACAARRRSRAAGLA